MTDSLLLEQHVLLADNSVHYVLVQLLVRVVPTDTSSTPQLIQEINANIAQALILIVFNVILLNASPAKMDFT